MEGDAQAQQPTGEQERPAEPIRVRNWADILPNPPKRAPVLIGTEGDGVLRLGHVMELTGASKAGKSMSALSLAAAVATGGEWCGIPCRRGRVLYLNFEIDEASQCGRIAEVWRAYAKRGATQSDAANLDVANLRGHPLLEGGMDGLSAAVVEAAAAKAAKDGAEALKGYYSLIIFDPFYMAFNGDENNAGDVKGAVRQFLAVAVVTGAAVAYIHHHAKGASGGKDSIDRGAGSGVHGRAPDAIVDIADLSVKDTVRDAINERFGESAVPLRMSFTLREFRPHKPVEVLYLYPEYIVAPPSIGLEHAADRGKFGSDDRKAEREDRRWGEINHLIKRVVDAHPEGIERHQLYRELGDTSIGDSSEDTLKRWLKDNRCDFAITEDRSTGKRRWLVTYRDQEPG